MGITISDNRESYNVQWTNIVGCHNTKILENLSNDLVTSIGHQIFSISNTIGLDLSSWKKEVIDKNIYKNLSENGIHGMNPIKEVSKSFMSNLSNYSVVLTNFDNPNFIEFGSSNNSGFLPSKGKNKTMNVVSCTPSSGELLEALRPTFKVPENSVRDDILFHRGVSGTNLGSQNFGVSSCSDYHSKEVNKKSDLSIITATEGWFFPKTKSEDLLDVVVANRCLHTN